MTRCRACLPLVAVAVALALAAAGCGGEEQGASTAFAPFDTPLDVGAVELPDVSPTGRGAPVAMGAAPGGVQLVFFGYTTCPDVCPTTLARIRQARRDLDAAEASRVSVAFVTVDLERDTPERLNGYVGSFVPRYLAFRAASPAALACAERAFKAAHTIERKADGAIAVTHTSVLYAVDDTAHAIGMWRYGTAPEAIADDLRRLLDDAATGAGS